MKYCSRRHAQASINSSVRYWPWTSGDMPKDRLSHGWVWGALRKPLLKQVQTRKTFHLQEVNIVIIYIKSNARDKTTSLYVLSYIGFMLLVVRPGNRTIAILSRGVLQWVTWSYPSESAQTFTSLASYLFVIVCVLCMWGLISCGYFHGNL
jgi:hypothetical protein